MRTTATTPKAKAAKKATARTSKTGTTAKPATRSTSKPARASTPPAAATPETVTVKIPARISEMCAEHGTTAAEFVRAITEDALEHPEIARDLIRDLFPLPPVTKAKVQAYADTNGLPPAAAIVATERAAAHRPKTILHIGITEATAQKIRRQAERRGMRAEGYVMDTIIDRLAADFVDAAQDAGALPATYRLDIPRATFRHLEATATQQGFRSLPAMLLHLATAYAWPADRMTILGQWPDFNRWNQAAQANREPLADWIRKWLNTAAESDLATLPAPEPNTYGTTVHRKPRNP